MEFEHPRMGVHQLKFNHFCIRSTVHSFVPSLIHEVIDWFRSHAPSRGRAGRIAQMVRMEIPRGSGSTRRFAPPSLALPCTRRPSRFPGRFGVEMRDWGWKWYFGTGEAGRKQSSCRVSQLPQTTKESQRLGMLNDVSIRQWVRMSTIHSHFNGESQALKAPLFQTIEIYLGFPEMGVTLIHFIHFIHF